MLPKIFSFVDVETSGARPLYDRIIEIGIVRVEEGKVVGEFSTLLNPQKYVDLFVHSLTGITASDLENAPTFYEVKDQILEMLRESVFVAHNVAFDYGFLRNEFKRYEQSFSMKHFCTLRISRILYPRHKRHDLDSIIKRCKIVCKRRHRALDDAKALWEFFQHVSTVNFVTRVRY